MRIFEITDAQGQLELLRTIIDNTWGAIANQAEQERRAEAERIAKEKLKPRASKAVKAPYAPSPPPLKKPPTPVKKLTTPLAAPPPPKKDNTITPIRDTNKPLTPSLPYTNPQHNLTALSNPSISLVPSKYPHTDEKQVFLGKNIASTNKHDNGDDRHSQNGIHVLKFPTRNF